MLDITYPEIEDYVLGGLTPAQIAQTLADDPRTKFDIPVDILRQYAVVEWRLIVPDPITGQRSGPLVQMYSNLLQAEQFEAADGVSRLINHLMDNASAVQVLTSTRADYAHLWHTLSAQILDSEQLAEMEAVHGGRKYAGVQEADVIRVIREHDITTRLTAAYEAAIIARDNGDSVSDVKLAIDSAWGS